MYFPVLTQSQLSARNVDLETFGGIDDIIRDQIESHLTSEVLAAAKAGQKYYATENDIIDRIITYEWDGRTISDQRAPNVKKAHAFMPTLVDQKVAYIAAKPPTITADDERWAEILNQTLGKKKFHAAMIDTVENCSNEAVTYIHPFINKQGEFDYQVMSMQEFIPIYESRFNRKLVAAIRYYPMVQVEDESTETPFHKVEVWTPDFTLFFVQTANGFEPDPDVSPNPRFHWYSINTAFPDQVEGHSWGRVPLIEIRNNKKCRTDLSRVKELIDDYDLTNSDFSNNLISIQDAMVVLKGYGGNDPEELRQYIKVRKVVDLDDGGTVEMVTIEIPHEAREKNSDRLRNDIFAFSQGYDPTVDKLGNNHSGTAIKFLYGPLDQKSNKLIGSMDAGITELVWFAGEYLERIEETPVSDREDFTIVWNKSMVVNEQELIQNLNNSKGLISDKTIISNHPMVDDVEAEIAQMESEAESIISLEEPTQ